MSLSSWEDMKKRGTRMKPLIFDWKNKKAKKLINSEKKIWGAKSPKDLTYLKEIVKISSRHRACYLIIEKKKLHAICYKPSQNYAIPWSLKLKNMPSVKTTNLKLLSWRRIPRPKRSWKPRKQSPLNGVKRPLATGRNLVRSTCTISLGK